MNDQVAAVESHAAGNSALITFCIYIAAVLLIAWLSSRLRRSRPFLGEYFLGSRALGLWGFALTFAATSSSGGSFIGFPSLVYSHGWILALWIASYMMVPLVAMGMLGKRLNQIARKTQAITIPDLIRDRLESPVLGIIATCLILFFLTFNLVAQFKGGSLILQSLLQDEPLFQRTSIALADALGGVPILGSSSDKPSYLLCLLVFAGVAVIYTAYGGFRAVVWTDVLQGCVMLGGVLILLPLTLWAVGGLGSATRELANMTPPLKIQLELSLQHPVTNAALNIPHNTWIVSEEGGRRRVFRTAARSQILPGETIAQIRSGSEVHFAVPGIELTYEPHVQNQQASNLSSPVRARVLDSVEFVSGGGQRGVYVTGPGPEAAKSSGFLPISLAISFFFMWTFSGAGQPSNMVRLMAFDHPTTLRRAIFAVSIYYSLIYFPLVIIFCCARVLLPGWETESDRIMPEMARTVTSLAGLPWLAGLLVAAPFAAVMSTMDSFLLMISSAIVRDIYMRGMNPKASERRIKGITYTVTILVGGVAMLAAASPPPLLQEIIIFTGSGLSSCFLFPVALMLYWPRLNWQGAMAGMLGGFVSYSSLYAIGTLLHPQRIMTAYEPMNFHPFIIGSLVSLFLCVFVSALTARPPDRLIHLYFCKNGDA